MARRRDDDDDDFPRRRSRFTDDDDDDDNDGRSRRRRGGDNSGMMLVIAFGVVGLLVVFGGIGLVAYFLLRGGPAEVAKEEGQPAAGQQRGAAAAPPSRPAMVQPARPRQIAADDVPAPGGGRPPRVGNAPGVVPLPSINPRIRQIVFGGGASDHAAIVAYKDRGAGMQVDIVNAATGAAKGRVLVDSANDNGFAVSPDGDWLAVLGSAPGKGHPVLLYSFNGQQVNSFTPYPRGGAKSYLIPETVWASFIAKDKLITINESGGFDVWSVPGFKRLLGQAGRPSPANPRVQTNGFTHCPVNFALTPDGKKLAIFNGTGYSFYDTATAAATAQTPAFMRAKGSANFSGAAFSPDGKRFASYFRTFGPGAATTLAIWDTQTGKQVGGGPTKELQSPAGMGWWGSDHLLFWRGGIADADLFSIESRQVIGRVKTTIPGKLATVPPNGELWGTTGGSLFDTENGASFLIRADVPARIGPKAEFELTTSGLQEK